MSYNLYIKYYLLRLHFLCHQSNKHPPYVDPLCMILYNLLICVHTCLVSYQWVVNKTKLFIYYCLKKKLNNSVPLWVSYIFFHYHTLFCLKKIMQCVKCNVYNILTPKVIRINILLFQKSVFMPEKDISVWIRNYEKYFGGTGAGSFCSLGAHIRNSPVCFHYPSGTSM